MKQKRKKGKKYETRKKCERRKEGKKNTPLTPPDLENPNTPPNLLEEAVK